jgi:carbonic anhydrase
MVAQFHHRAPDGRQAIVAVLLQRGEPPHPAIQAFWNSLPLERGGAYTPMAAVDLASLLPPGAGHYLYMGSLTTPPCTEGVLWAVMKEPVPISDDQLAIFARLYPRNSRPIQPPNGRRILESR